eukprot:m.237744 g.237744  ORF g.237744 m.237744 type:complete len:969 (-) comp13190_c0_seq1:129-3035(-)
MGDRNACVSCKTDIDPEANGFPAPDLGVAGAVIRRVDPLAWADGVPQNFKSYPVHYEVLLVKTTVPAAEKGETDKEVWMFPSASSKYGVNPTAAVNTNWPQLKAKRALFVDMVAVPELATALLLYCLPIDKNNESNDYSGIRADWKNATFFSLHLLLTGLRGLRPPRIELSLDAKLCLVRLDRWLAETHHDAASAETLWQTPSYVRIKQVEVNRAHQAKGVKGTPAAAVVRNPLYRAGLVVVPPGGMQDNNIVLGDDAEELAAVTLQRGDSPEPDQTAKMQLWGERYPLHKAACEGDAELVRRLIREGRPPAGVDTDTWTPLHYAAWHGKESVVRTLMEEWKGAPAAQTDGGRTALHLAARNGWVDIVRILLACPLVTPSQVDNDGHSPLWLCEQMKVNQWEEVSRLLRNPQGVAAESRFSYEPGAELTELRIALMDGSEKVVRVPGGDQTTTESLRNAVAGILNVAEESWNVFGIWIRSPSVEFQLALDMKPSKRLKRWQEMVDLYGSGSPETPVLQFRRNANLTLSDERKTRSPIALKLLFDEAVYNCLISAWPIGVDEAVHLAGLIMQIRYGTATDQHYRGTFIAQALPTLVSPHLHSQLKITEWQKRIQQAHLQHAGKTELPLLHRLFLQYCYQWRFYGAVFFPGALSKVKRGVFSSKDEDVRIGVNTDWLCIISADTNQLRGSLAHDQFRYNIEDSNVTMNIDFAGADRSRLTGLADFLKGQPDNLHFVSRQTFLLSQFIDSIMLARLEAERAQQKLRMDQGGPQVLKHVSTESFHDIDHFEERKRREQLARYHLLHSFGQAPADQRCAAQLAFERFAKDGAGMVPITSLKNVCYELGYWLGVELDGARLILGANGGGQFSFRDLVAWWAQASRNWLFLLDDEAFLQRSRAVEVFASCDPNRLGKVSAEGFPALIAALHSSGLTTKAEDAIRKGLDPQGRGVAHFNDFITWLAHMGLIADRVQ